MIDVAWDWQHLKSGDYSLRGYEERVAIERKSLADLFSTFGQHRDRFQRELERLAELDFAALVVEADWPTIFRSPPERSRLNPKTIWRSCVSWSVRYRVPWFNLPDRRLAEVTTYRLLEKWWIQEKERAS